MADQLQVQYPSKVAVNPRGCLFAARKCEHKKRTQKSEISTAHSYKTGSSNNQPGQKINSLEFDGMMKRAVQTKMSVVQLVPPVKRNGNRPAGRPPGLIIIEPIFQNLFSKSGEREGDYGRA